MNRTEQADALGRIIDDAFADAVWPEPQNLVPHPFPRPSEPTFRDLEEPYIRAHFGGKRRSDLNYIDAGMAGMIEEFLSMTGPAVKYYLPCFLKHVLGKPEFITVISLIGFLDIERSASQGFTWPRFTDEQQVAVLAFVDYLLRHIRSYQLGEFEDEYLKQLQTVRQQWKRLRR
jgi:hypothetical protein